MRVGPSDGNRDWSDHRFWGAGRLDIAGVKGKNGGDGFFDGSGGLLRPESDGSCNGMKLF